MAARLFHHTACQALQVCYTSHTARTPPSVYLQAALDLVGRKYAAEQSTRLQSIKQQLTALQDKLQEVLPAISASGGGGKGQSRRAKECLRDAEVCYAQLEKLALDK